MHIAWYGFFYPGVDSQPVHFGLHFVTCKPALQAPQHVHCLKAFAKVGMQAVVMLSAALSCRTSEKLYSVCLGAT